MTFPLETTKKIDTEYQEASNVCFMFVCVFNFPFDFLFDPLVVQECIVLFLHA